MIDQRFEKQFPDIDEYNCQYCESAFGKRKGPNIKPKILTFLKDEINLTLAAIEARAEMEDIPYNYLEDLRRIIHSYKV